MKASQIFNRGIIRHNAESKVLVLKEGVKGRYKGPKTKSDSMGPIFAVRSIQPKQNSWD